MPGDIHDESERPISPSSLGILCSSVFDQDSFERNVVVTTSSSDSSRSSNNKNSIEDLSPYDPLTEAVVTKHNAEFKPMNSKERIHFWDIADEFSDIEDDFDDKKNLSKPNRSERVSTLSSSMKNGLN